MNFFFLSQVLSALGVGFGSFVWRRGGEDKVERTLNFFFFLGQYSAFGVAPGSGPDWGLIDGSSCATLNSGQSDSLS